MKVIKIKKLKNDKYRLTLDNEVTLDLFDDVILENNILYKKEISDDLLESIDMDLVSYYKDDFLNITYGIPGGDWGMAQIEDTTGIENVCLASAGEDGVFDIKSDILAEEVISSVCLFISSLRRSPVDI